jgi:dUTP pyrophosphatase
VVNSPGTIDTGFRGQVCVILKYTGTGKADDAGQLDFKRGDRIAQMLIKEVPEVEMIAVAELNPSKRGEGGFGSTNKA